MVVQWNKVTHITHRNPRITENILKIKQASAPIHKL